ncbi:hypothetical protein [Bacteroides fragilis]|jgi:hypothetical protein|uniref:hypothetical protein n=1 Tax=Bacteroides fragilis TaxID=817 RepID=UPI0020307505|nr:hypothetical protein [Bacteroides fragilis]MCM0201349.1 hypothetical protein [Bacteroides fragilis]DAO85702.1 MAG TPA: hypothetical protein [Caudoviricetes sp.]
MRLNDNDFKKNGNATSIVQEIKFNIQDFICILNLVITEVPGYSILYLSES